MPDVASAKQPTSSRAAGGKGFASQLFGYDIFLSFALGPPPRGTQSYASDLARRLRERDFTVFFSETEAPPGSPLDRTLRKALPRSRALVVVANRDMLEDPRWVRSEVQEFHARRPNRPIIPINVDGALQEVAQAKSWLPYEGNIWIDESAKAVSDGIASDATVDRLAVTPRFIKANVRWRWTIGASFVLLVGLTIGLVVSTRAAIDRANELRTQLMVAEGERMRALSAQNFAEHERVRARMQTVGVPDDEKKALQAIAPKYLDQSKRAAEESKRLQKALDDWRRELRVPAAIPDTTFTLEVFRAQMGTAFLVHYGNPGSPRHVLIDGGPRGTYRDAIQPRLQALRAAGKPLPLSLVVATQTDIQHLQGLIDLVEDLQRQRPDDRLVTVDSLWSNAFVPGTPETAAELAKANPKGRLVAGARSLHIPVNAPFTRMVAAPEAGAARVTLDEGFTITVLSPRVQWLRRFADAWLADWRKRVSDARLLTALDDYEIVETFADRRIELVPSPVEIVDPPTERGRDASVVNLASTVLMLEVAGRRMLLPADARSDVILAALAQAGYTDEQGNMNVDLLVLPHGGSANNVSVDFFRRVRAKHYVISNDGALFRNPDLSTFEMLFAARRDDRQSFSIALSYPPEEYKSAYPIRALCALLERERAAGLPFTIVTPKAGLKSFGIDLWSESKSVDKGVRDSVCL